MVGVAGFEPATPSSRTRPHTYLCLNYHKFLLRFATNVHDLGCAICGDPVAHDSTVVIDVIGASFQSGAARGSDNCHQFAGQCYRLRQFVAFGLLIPDRPEHAGRWRHLNREPGL